MYQVLLYMLLHVNCGKFVEEYRTMSNIYIASKLSKVGKRFAFVRFLRATNEEELSESICSMWIEKNHICAYVASISRGCLGLLFK